MRKSILLKLALIPAVRAVFYLQEGKSKLTTDKGAKAFHALSDTTVSLFHCDITKPGTDNPILQKQRLMLC
jgi:hypothetical protein